MANNENKTKEGEYIEHVTEAEPKARNYGDAQVLVAGEKDKTKEYPDQKEKVGNQSKEYYNN